MPVAWSMSAPKRLTTSVISHHFLLFSIFFYLFRAEPMAYGISQGRSQIGAAPAWLCHSGAGYKPCLATYTTA